VNGILAPSGALALVKSSRTHRLDGTRYPVVQASWGWRTLNLLHKLPGMLMVGMAHLFTLLTGLPVMYGRLSLMKFDGALQHWVDYGVVGYRVVTTAGVGYIVDAFQNSVELENMKYHGFGTGSTAEASGDTALVTELTTEYVVDSTRPTGSTTEGAANVYRTVATLSPDSGGTIALREHGVFSASSAGVLLDRTVYAAINLVASSDSLQATYDLTFTAGS
jgi:hypothetical protein